MSVYSYKSKQYFTWITNIAQHLILLLKCLKSMTFFNKLKIVGQLLRHQNNTTPLLENNPLILHDAPHHTAPLLIIFLQQHTRSCFIPYIPLLIYSDSMRSSYSMLCLQGWNFSLAFSQSVLSVFWDQTSVIPSQKDDQDILFACERI